MVHLTRIYTKTGDDGTTSLGDMSRTSKNDPRLGQGFDSAAVVPAFERRGEGAQG